MIKRYLIYVLVCTLVFPLGLLAKQKRGTDLVVQTKDEQIFRGELITVKQYTLLLLSEEGADVTVDIREVRNLTIVNKSKAGKGFLQGALYAGGAFALLAVLEQGTDWDDLTYYAVTGSALIGGVIGGLFGAGAGRDETILVSTKTDAEIQEILNQLRSKARVTDYN